MHKITIKNKSPGKPLTGASTELLLDGKPLKGVVDFTLDITPRDVAKITIEMLADVEMVDVEIGNLERKSKKRA